MSNIVKKVILRNTGSTIIDVKPSFADGTYFALDPDFDTGKSRILFGETVTYGVIFVGSDVTGEYTDTFIVSNTDGKDLTYHLTATVTDLLPNFYCIPESDSTIDLGNSISNYDDTVTITIGNGTVTSEYFMFVGFAYRCREQVIYLQSEIGQYVSVVSLSFNVYQIPSIIMSNFTIRMKHTTLSVFPDTGAIWESSGWTTVYSANKTISSTGWITFIFSTPFVYNGIDNLMIDFSFDNPGPTGYPNGYLYKTYAASNPKRTVHGSDYNSYSAPTNWTGTSPTLSTYAGYTNIKMEFSTILPVPSDTAEVKVTNETKSSIVISAPSFTPSTYFALDNNFATGEIILEPGRSAIYGVYFIGSIIINETYISTFKLINGYGSDIIYHLTANTFVVPKLSASPVSGSSIDFVCFQGLQETSSVTITNDGDAGSVINLTGATFTGIDAALFDLVTPFVNPTALTAHGNPSAPGSQDYSIRFLGSGSVGAYESTLTFTNDFNGDIFYNLSANVIYPPDNFVNAFELTGTLPISGSVDNTGFTSEVGEPDHLGWGNPYSPSASAWYKWESTFSGVLLLSISGPNYIGGGIYTDSSIIPSVSTLTPINNQAMKGDRGYSSTYTLSCPVTLGTIYYIALDAYSGNTGVITFEISKLPDNFVDAELLSGTLPITKTSDNTGATAEPEEGDPDSDPPPAYLQHMLLGVNLHTVKKSLWYKWIPEESRTIRLMITGGGDYYYPSAALYSGSSIGSLTVMVRVETNHIGSSYHYSTPIAVTKDVTYYIAAGFYNTNSATFTLTISSV